MKMKPKTKKLINKLLNAISKDISYSYGGWLFFAGRMTWNAIILYYVFGFVKAILTFSFISQGVPIPAENLEVVGTVIWAIGLIYLLARIPTWREDKQ